MKDYGNLKKVLIKNFKAAYDFTKTRKVVKTRKGVKIMATTEKTVRITKAMRFEDIKSMLWGSEVQNGTSVQEAVDFLDREIALLAKKNSRSSGSKKPTAEQEANAIFKAHILEFLGTLPADSDGVTCTEIQKAVPGLENWQVQKTSQLMLQLGDKGSGQVINQKIKGKSLFKLA
jgi:hypothetical protein